MPTRRRLTVLRASAGFGKTTLLAECCRMLRSEGVNAAWVTLDEQDQPEMLDSYIAFACYEAGLGMLDAPDPDPGAIDSETRAGMVIHELQRTQTPFVIAFDDVDRLTSPRALSLLEFLLQRGPPNLHLAFACRRIPKGVDLAGAVLDGHAQILDTEELRFSPSDVARYFDLRLSRRALAEEVNRSAGWPFALRVSRNSVDQGPEGRTTPTTEDLIDNWIESRLFAGLGPDDRDLVLDLGLFPWIDAELLDEILQSSGSMRRVLSTGALEGLLERTGTSDAASWRLHSLIRDHCVERQRREDPERLHRMHRRVATALARRGETIVAMHHALQGDSPGLAGEILERAGGVRLWLLWGVTRFQQADGLLPEEVVARVPRLKLVRIAALMLAGRTQQARRLHAELDVRSDGTDGDDFDYRTDAFAVHVAMGVYGIVPIGTGWLRTLLHSGLQTWGSPRLDSAVRGQFEYALGVLHYLVGEFDSALDRLATSRELLAGTTGSYYIAFYGEVLHGQIDFNAGRVRRAEARYVRAQRMAREHFPFDPIAATASRVAMCELAMECCTSNVIEPPRLLSQLMNRGVPFSYFATACNLLIDTQLAGRGEALAATDQLLAHLRRAGMTTFARLLTSLRVSVLVIAGRVDAAETAWRREKLPVDNADCLDLTTQSLWELQAVCEGRVRLLVAAGRHGDARELLGRLMGFAEVRSFRKLRMRALALSIMLEQRAGATEESARLLLEYLGLFGESPFAWPLVREWQSCMGVVSTFLKSNPDSPYGEAAASILATMRRIKAGPRISLSRRELEVLQQLSGNTDKQIGALLGLTVYGVRYHLRKLFDKLQVSSRRQLIRRAEDMDLIPRNDS